MTPEFQMFQPVQPEIRGSVFKLKLSVAVMLLGHATIHDIPYTWNITYMYIRYIVQSPQLSNSEF